MSERALFRRAREAKAWLFDACFPLWAEAGIVGGVFIESLDLQNRPVESETVRVRVQGRQTYMFAEAARLGWSKDRAIGLVEFGVDVLRKQARRSDGLYGRVLRADGSGLADETGDLYDTAFALHAFAHAARALDAPEAARDALAAGLTAVDDRLRDPGGFYRASEPDEGRRLQNPHMHLLEACLAVHAADPSSDALERAEALRALALERFYSSDAEAVFEVFDADWRVVDDRVEPGHQFEWVWLLDRLAAAAGRPAPDVLSALYATAVRSLDGEGRACMAVGPDGAPRDASRRTWSQTEALKAHLVMWRRGDDLAVSRAVQAFDVLMDEHLTPEGGWIDRYDAAGQPVGDLMPASTGYHVVLAFAELLRLCAD